MQILRLVAVVAMVIPLAGCLETDTERALAGAAAGAVLADATENSVVTGAVLGAGAGAFCDDVNLCAPSQ